MNDQDIKNQIDRLLNANALRVIASLTAALAAAQARYAALDARGVDGTLEDDMLFDHICQIEAEIDRLRLEMDKTN